MGETEYFARQGSSMSGLEPDTCPNVAVITCHDLGRHLRCFGIPTVRTPHLDALAESGARFERAFATSSGCSPSRAALATGCYPHVNGVMGLTHPPFNWNLRPDVLHITHMLGGAGYDRHLFGFQHVTTSVDRLAFDEFHGFDRVVGCYETAWGANVAARVAGFLQARQSSRPLYMEINLEEVHRPFDQGGSVPDEADGIFIPPYLPPGSEVREEMAALQGAIRQADRAVGEILAALDRAGMRDDTLVIFIADHGLAMPRAKCTLYDPGIEVALLVRWPAGSVCPGQVRPEMISNIDVLPTILEAAGAAPPPQVQGRSFLPLLRGDTYAPRTEIYAEKTYHSYYDPMRALRTERFKYIRNFEVCFAVEVPGDVQMGATFRAHVDLYHAAQHPPIELYDLHADPLEQHNLAGDLSFVEIERRLDSSLRAWMVETHDPLLRGPIPSPMGRRIWETFG